MEREYLSMEGSKTAAAVSDAIISAPGFIAPHVHCPCLAIHLFIIIIISFNGNRNSERERERVKKLTASMHALSSPRSIELSRKQTLRRLKRNELGGKDV